MNKYRTFLRYLFSSYLNYHFLNPLSQGLIICLLMSHFLRMAWVSLDFTSGASGIKTIPRGDKGVFPLDVGFPSNWADSSIPLGHDG